MMSTNDPPASGEWCLGFDAGWEEAMADRLDRNKMAAAIDEYMGDGGTEFRAYDLADHIIKRFVPPMTLPKQDISKGEGSDGTS